MGKHDFKRRVYGSRYHETRTISELDLLGERILADLPMFLNTTMVPAGADFGIHLVANILLRLNVGGLKDDFIYADPVSGRYTMQAIDLVSYLNIVLESYNWTNHDAFGDRRFFCSVHLINEADYKSIFWTPGVVRIL